jgi:hypothetical protein
MISFFGIAGKIFGSEVFERLRCTKDGALSLVPTGFAVITPSDATTYDPPLRAIYVGGAGHVTVTGKNLASPPVDATCLFSSVPQGTILEGEFSKVMAATTATLLVGLR